MSLHHFLVFLRPANPVLAISSFRAISQRSDTLRIKELRVVAGGSR